MAENTRVEPLSGSEVITDLLANIEHKLKQDCNLRDYDAYGRGYSAKVEIRLELYGMDTAKVEQKYTIGPPQDEADAVVVEKIEVPVELDLDKVRDRSGQEPVNLAKFDAPADPNAPKPAPRRYVRRATGGMNEVVV